MGYFNFDFEKYRPSISQGKPLQPKGLVTPIAQPTLKPQQVSQPSAQFVPQPAEDKSIMQKVLDAFSVPSEKTEKFLTGGKTYEERLAERGVSEPVRNVAGFAGRMILDPLNIIPFGAIGKVAKIPQLLSKVGKVTSKIPGVAKATEALGTRFVRGYKLPKEYNLAKAEIPTKIGIGTKQIVERTKQQFAGLKKNVIEAIPKFLEPKGAGVGVNLRALRQELGEETFGKIRPVLRQVKEQFDSDITDLVQRGRMTGQTAKRLLNQGGYYPHTDFAPERIKQYFVRPKLGERRTYLKRRKGAEGFTFNAPKAISKREYIQFSDNVLQDFFKEVKNKFGVKIGAGKPMPEGFTEFLSSNRRTQELRGWALPARIAKDINDSVIDPLGDLGRGIDTFNRWWKPTATSLNPAFHFMNVMGNLYNSWLGGMKDPRRFLQAVKGGFKPGEKEILERTGILARGQFGADIVSRTFDSPDIKDANRIFGAFRKTGEFFENNARGAFFLDQRSKLLRQGLSDAQANRRALGKVNEYLFDYLSGLTPFETNVMRRFFPFYTWARFNIPLQFKSLVTAPEKVALVSKVNRELNKGGAPEGDQEGITVPTPFTDSNGNPIRYRPNLPIQDIFLNPQRLFSMISPFFKETANIGLYAGGAQKELTDPFSGQQITNKYLPIGTQIKDIAGSRAKALLRPARTVSKLEEDFTPAGFARQLLGGTYTLPRESVELRKVRKRNAINSAINQRIQQIHGNTTMTREDKLREIDNLLRSRQ